MEAEWHQILLMNDDKSLSINVWFFGYPLEKVNEFIQEHYSSGKRWTQFKLIS